MTGIRPDDERSLSQPRGSSKSPLLVVGLGNPILGDDAVGWRVAEEVSRLLLPGTGEAQEHSSSSAVEVDCLSLGGLSLMERLVGYAQTILVDAIHTGEIEPGTVRAFDLDQLADPVQGHTTSAHDTSLRTAIEVGRAMGAPLPTMIKVVAIETPEAYDFSEQLSPEVAAAVPAAAAAVVELLAQMGHLI